MELLDTLSSIYAWDNDPWDLYPGHDAVHAVEVQMDTTGSPYCTSRKLTYSSEISAWTQQSSASISGTSPATLQLLCFALSNETSGRLDAEELRVKKNSLKEAMSAFNIPEAALSHTVSWVPGFLKFPVASAKSDIATYGIFQLSLSIAWSYDADQCSTKAIVWYEEMTCPLSRTLLELEKLRNFVDQPMFLGLLSCIMMTRKLAVERRQILKTVQQAEIQIGMEKGYQYLGDNPWIGAPANYAELSSIVAEASILRTDLCVRLGAVCNFTLQVAEHHSMLSHATQQQHPRKPSRDRADAMNENLTLVRDHANQLLAHANGMEERMGVQMSRILALIAQEDQRFNSLMAQDSRILAIESKRDSTAMKVLAGVTTAFLPGTFTASLFAMPLFRWDASSGNDVVNHRFWIYWAVAIPLTIFTFCAWLWWFKFEAAQERREDEIALTQTPIRFQKPPIRHFSSRFSNLSKTISAKA